MENPFPSLKKPYWQPANVSISHPDSRPRGFIQVFRIYQNIDNEESFKSIATSSVLRNLKNRPLAVEELSYKIKQDEFLKRPEVIAQGLM